MPGVTIDRMKAAITGTKCYSCHAKIHAERGDCWHRKSYSVEDGF